MLHADPRGSRVALVADAIINDGAAGFDVLALAEAADFGVIVLPPADFEIGTIARIVEYVVDDLVEYRSTGYRVVVIGSSALAQFGVWDDLVEVEIRRRRIEPFERFDVQGASPQSLSEFLGESVTA